MEIGKRLDADTAKFWSNKFYFFLSQIVVNLRIQCDFMTFHDSTNRENQMALGKFILFIALNIVFCYFFPLCGCCLRSYVDYALNGPNSIISTSLNAHKMCAVVSEYLDS